MERSRIRTPLDRPAAPAALTIDEPAAPQSTTVAVDVRARVTQRVPAVGVPVDAATVVMRAPAAPTPGLAPSAPRVKPDVDVPARWETVGFVPPAPERPQEREPDTRVQWAPPAPSPPRSPPRGRSESKREPLEAPGAKSQAASASLHPALTAPTPFAPEAPADTHLERAAAKSFWREPTRVRPERARLAKPAAGVPEPVATRRVAGRFPFLVMVALGACAGTALVLTFFLALTWSDGRAHAPTPVARGVEESRPLSGAVPQTRQTPQAPQPPVAKTGMVRIVTEPEATVFVDGRDLGPQPVSVQLPVGPATLVLENLKLGLKRTVSIDVAPSDQNLERFVFPRGWIEIDAPATSTVAVDGKTVVKRTVKVFEGLHRVEVTHGDKRHTRAVQAANVVGGVTTTVYFEPPSLADE